MAGAKMGNRGAPQQPLPGTQGTGTPEPCRAPDTRPPDPPGLAAREGASAPFQRAKGSHEANSRGFSKAAMLKRPLAETGKEPRSPDSQRQPPLHSPSSRIVAEMFLQPLRCPQGRALWGLKEKRERRRKLWARTTRGSRGGRGSGCLDSSPGARACKRSEASQEMHVIAASPVAQGLLTLDTKASSALVPPTPVPWQHPPKQHAPQRRGPGSHGGTAVVPPALTEGKALGPGTPGFLVPHLLGVL